ncbi:nitronate monooxygenase family protein [Afifella sp. IM 167]|uniref:NAD(P)H-dependent flavin oxidoreductase n=1 Tax=Afifella sp. IM 167 TaxID=2033586 RepID=UPI001CC9B4E4|nr:nitronate monooxygenase [Afifella sp. IM 167]MBZ8131691.1 nitronate monooxygenase [Afifella sp. IM 167]
MPVIFDRRLAKRLDLEHPIVQAPMAGVSTPAMAAAVSNAGGLGSIGLGAASLDQAREMIAATKAVTDRAFNVNLFCHQPPDSHPVKEAAWLARLAPQFRHFGAEPPAELTPGNPSFLVNPAMLELLLETRPAVVSFHFGLPPAETIDALHGAGILLLATATGPAEGRAVAEAGIDAVVAQGIEAGGHRGIFDEDGPDDGLGVFALTRLLVRELDIPVIAAGGIMDGAGIAAVLRLGAAAAQLGTAFIAADESSADTAFRAALAGEGAAHTRMVRAISGRPARSLPTRFTALAADLPPDEVPAFPIAYAAGRALAAAAKAAGEPGFGAQWAGQGAPMARPMAAAELVATLAEEMHAA